MIQSDDSHTVHWWIPATEVLIILVIALVFNYAGSDLLGSLAEAKCSDHEANKLPADVCQDLTAAEQWIDDIRQQNATLAEEVDYQAEQLETELGRLGEERRQYEHVVAQLGQRLADLRAKLREAQQKLAKALSELRATQARRDALAGLSSQLAERQQQADQVAKEISTQELQLQKLQEAAARARPKAVEIHSTPVQASADGREAHLFHLSGGRIIPFVEPFIDAELVRAQGPGGGLITATKLTRAKSGEDIAAMEKKSSDFLKALGNIDAKNGWAAFLVCSDSYPAFRVARRLARERGLMCGWEPMFDGPVYVSSFGRELKPDEEKR